jgi:hypothetical protein
VAIVVEDGTGKVDAVSYVAIATVGTYQAARGRTAWAALASDTLREQACVRATDYVELRFAARYRGSRRAAGQALGFPRINAIDNSGHSLNGVPIHLVKACCEYALISALLGELAARPPAPNGSQNVATGVVTASAGASGIIESLTQIVGPITNSVTYASRGSESLRTESGGLVSSFNLPQYPLADSWLAELLRNSSSIETVLA